MRKALQALLASEESSFHLVLTAEYLKECGPVGDELHNCTFQGKNGESFRRLSWHAARSYLDMLEVLLGNPYYITRKLQLCSMEDVLSDFDFLQFSPRKEEFRQLHRILTLSSRVLTIDPYPSQLYVQLLLKRGETADPQTDAMIEILRDDRSAARLLPVQKYGEDADSPLEGSFEVALNRGTRCLFWSQYLVTLTDNQVLIYDKISGKIQKRSRLPQKKPNLFFCGSAFMCSGLLSEPVSSFSPEHCESREILPAHPGEETEGNVFLFSDGDELKLMTIRNAKELIILDSLTRKEEKSVPLETEYRLLAADDSCYLLVREGREECHVILCEQGSDRRLGQTTISDPVRSQVFFSPIHALICSEGEVLVFDKKSGELKMRLRTETETKELGAYRQVCEDEEYLYVSRDHGFLDLYNKETLEFERRLKLHEEAIIALASNKVNLFTLDEKGKVCVWNRARLGRKENEGTDSDVLIRDIFQANGSVYTFSRSHSTAMSPVNLKVRRKGIPVFCYNPEIRLRRYLVHWYKEPLKLMLLNTETLQNDYSCEVPYPEGFGPDDLVRCYWQDTTGYLLCRRAEDGHVAVQVLDMNTDQLVKTVTYEDYREGCELIFAEGSVWLFSAFLRKERYSYPGKCWCEVRELGSEEIQFFIKEEKIATISDCFVEGNLLVFTHRVKSGKNPRQEILCCDLSLWLKKKMSGEIKSQALKYAQRLQENDASFVCVQNGMALYQYENGSYAIFQPGNGELIKCPYAVGERILSASLTKAGYFLAREEGEIEYHSLSTRADFCTAFLDSEIVRIVGTGAGLVTVLTEDGSVLSFQMEKARQSERRD